MDSTLGVNQSKDADSMALAALYQGLPTVDFSHDVLERQASVLRVVPVPNCGWSDLGTPERVAETLRRIPSEWPEQSIPGESVPNMNLADQNSRLQGYLKTASASNTQTAV
jgi:mannose-1-phosphate guanylyltransferase